MTRFFHVRPMFRIVYDVVQETIFFCISIRQKYRSGNIFVILKWYTVSGDNSARCRSKRSQFSVNRNTITIIPPPSPLNTSPHARPVRPRATSDFAPGPWPVRPVFGCQTRNYFVFINACGNVYIYIKYIIYDIATAAAAAAAEGAVRLAAIITRN